MTARSAARGADYVFQGIREFYKYRQLWKYALPSVVVTFAADIFAFRFLLEKAIPYVEQCLKLAETSWCGGIVQPLYPVFYVLIWLTFLMALSVLSFALFEATGSFFFAGMVARYERDVLRSRNAPISRQNEIRDIVESSLYACGTVILAILLSILGFFLPVIAEFVKAFALGYRYAVSYAAEAGFIRDIRLQNLPKLIPSNVTASFGVTVYFILLIPFIGLFFIPGFFIGGAIMADREIP